MLTALVLILGAGRMVWVKCKSAVPFNQSDSTSRAARACALPITFCECGIFQGDGCTEKEGKMAKNRDGFGVSESVARG
jgi:hypothetical protein